MSKNVKRARSVPRYKFLYAAPDVDIRNYARRSDVEAELLQFCRAAAATPAVEIGWTYTAECLSKREGNAERVRGYRGDGFVLLDLHSHPAPSPFQAFPGWEDLGYSLLNPNRLFARNFVSVIPPAEFPLTEHWLVGWKYAPALLCVPQDELGAALARADGAVTRFRKRSAEFCRAAERPGPNRKSPLQHGLNWLAKHLPELQFGFVSLPKSA